VTESFNSLSQALISAASKEERGSDRGLISWLNLKERVYLVC